MRIVLMGAPGSGKGTQSKLLSAKLGIPQISTGDLLRDAVARATAYGRAAKAVMDAGGLVADDIVIGMIRERLAEPDAARGFLLDGFPRNLAQAEALARLLTGLRAPLDAVLLLEVESGELMRRLAGRRSCTQCGRVFNVHSAPPGTPPHCERCDDQPPLIQRSDDEEATVARRLQVYEAQTRPLARHYAEQGLLRTIDANGSVEQIQARLLRALAPAAPHPAPAP